MKKALLTAGIVTAVSAAGLAGAGVANATTNTNGQNNPFSSLVETIANKFNLNKTEVQAVFDEQRTQMQAAREQETKDQIAQLVTDGKLTQAQADKINAKRTELEAERANGQTQTQSERDSEREAHKTELDTWLKENDIDSEYVYLLMGGGRGHGPGGSRAGQDTSTTTTQ